MDISVLTNATNIDISVSALADRLFDANVQSLFFYRKNFMLLRKKKKTYVTVIEQYSIEQFIYLLCYGHVSIMHSILVFRFKWISCNVCVLFCLFFFPRNSSDAIDAVAASLTTGLPFACEQV